MFSSLFSSYTYIYRALHTCSTEHSILVLIRKWIIWLRWFPSYRRFLTPLQQTAFWKQNDKRRNCSKQAISPFITMFSAFSHRLSIQLWRYSFFWQSMFKVICCRIVVWGKGLTSHQDIYISSLKLIQRKRREKNCLRRLLQK